MGCRFSAILCSAAFLTGCPSVWQTPDDDVAPQPATCEAAYNNLVRLACPEAEGTRTMSWLEFCRVAEQSEGAIYIQTACIARASNIESIRECRVQCKK